MSHAAMMATMATSGRRPMRTAYTEHKRNTSHTHIGFFATHINIAKNCNVCILCEMALKWCEWVGDREEGVSACKKQTNVSPPAKRISANGPTICNGTPVSIHRFLPRLSSSLSSLQFHRPGLPTTLQHTLRFYYRVNNNTYFVANNCLWCTQAKMHCRRFASTSIEKG